MEANKEPGHQGDSFAHDGVCQFTPENSDEGDFTGEDTYLDKGKAVDPLESGGSQNDEVRVCFWCCYYLAEP